MIKYNLTAKRLIKRFWTLNNFLLFTADESKNFAPQAISIFSSYGEKVVVSNEAGAGTDVYNDKEKKSALAVTCEYNTTGKYIKKLLESVVKTPLKYVRWERLL